jgi:hypothetical protein
MSKLLYSHAFVSLLLLGIFAPAPNLIAQDLSDGSRKQLIEGEIALPNGSSAKFRGYEGDPILAKIKGLTSWYGFVPLLNEKHRVDIIPFEILEIDGVQNARQLSTLSDLAPGSVDKSVLLADHRQFQFSNLALCPLSIPETEKDHNELSNASLNAGTGICCVTCDGITVCGGSVTMSCNSCGKFLPM